MRALALLALALLAACGDSTTPEIPVPGEYVLVTVGGAVLPVDASFRDGFGVMNTRSLLSADLVIRDDGTFEEVRRYRLPSGPYQATHWGTWSGGGDEIRMEGWAGYAPSRVIRDRDGLASTHEDRLFRYLVK